MYSSSLPLTIDKILYNLKIISFEDPFTYEINDSFEQLACRLVSKNALGPVYTSTDEVHDTSKRSPSNSSLLGFNF